MCTRELRRSVRESHRTRTHDCVGARAEIATSLVDMQPDDRTALPKAKIQIWIRKSADFHRLVKYIDHAKR